MFTVTAFVEPAPNAVAPDWNLKEYTDDGIHIKMLNAVAPDWNLKVKQVKLNM